MKRQAESYRRMFRSFPEPTWSSDLENDIDELFRSADNPQRMNRRVLETSSL
ncbi:MAG: hypothetical protein ABIG89_02590 [Candidatus Woesearchaeota archaeon]